MEPEIQGNKEVTISFANAVAKENNRGSVSAAQKAGRSVQNPRVTRARTTLQAKCKGKGRATTLVANQGTKRKRQVVEASGGAGSSELSGPRKLRKRA
jgi:hypothetical protein